MKTIIKPGIWKILKTFYENKNRPLHLREIARRAKLNESSATRHLNALLKENILKAEKEANLKKFCIRHDKLPKVFPVFDDEKLEKLPLLRKKAIMDYLKKMDEKPVMLVVFGSTAKGTFSRDSDIDILEVYNHKTDNRKAKEYAEAQAGLKLQIFQVKEKELSYQSEPVIQSALETGFPVFNQKYYYEVVCSE